MRSRLPNTTETGALAIEEVKISRNKRNSRDAIPRLLHGLQEIYSNKMLLEQILDLLGSKILSGKKKTGRPGMCLWQILVLGVIRVGAGLTYARLLDLLNNHRAFRGIFGLGGLESEFSEQTMLDNVHLLDEELLKSINTLIVEAGNELLQKKKNDSPALNLKTDSFVVEINVHFPTDLNLLYQSGQKCVSLIGKTRLHIALFGWGKIKYWAKLLTKSSFKVSQVYRSKGKNYNQRLKSAVKAHLSVCAKIGVKINDSLLKMKALIDDSATSTPLLRALYENLVLFFAYFEKHQDLVNRRIIEGEKIPHEEKIFSLFEPHTEWISKGKAHKKVELGHAVCITTNQHHFCLHWEVMEKQSDVDMPLIIREFIQNNFGKYRIESWSFDRGFSSKSNQETLEEQVEHPVMPKKGKLSKKNKAKESEPMFRKYRRKHSTVEANISQLEHLGAGICSDKGIEGFKRYVGLAVLAYNIHRLGRIRPKY